jgi:hypothetical protein
MRGLYKAGVVSLTLGCVQTNAAVLDPSMLYQRTCPDAVVVYTSPERVGKPYREVALLNSKGESGWTSEAGMVNSQRKKAAEVGANGLVVGGIDEPKAGTKIIGALLGTGAERKGKAVAIFVPDDSTKTAITCAKGREPANSASSAPESSALAPSQSAAVPSEVPTPAPAPAEAPFAKPTEPSGRVDDVPSGTNWVADLKNQTYYRVGCPATAKIAPADRLYYGSESSLQSAGFKKSEAC